MRAPQRVSAPPSSGLAAVPLWPDPDERSPGRPFFSPHAGVTAVSRDGEVGHPVPFLPLSLIHLFGFWPDLPIRVRVRVGMATVYFFLDLKSVLSFSQSVTERSPDPGVVLFFFSQSPS